MKHKILKITAVLLLSVVFLNAQEKKKVHLKIVKEENGKVTEIDTVIDGTDKEGMYYFGYIDGMDINIDSILKEFKIEGHEGMKFITISDKYHSMDSLKHVWHSINADMDGDSLKVKKMIYIMEGGDKELIELKEGNVLISSDIHVVDGEHVFVTSDCGKVKVIEGKGDKSMIWATDEEGNINIEDHDGMKVITITEKMHSGDSLMNIWYSVDIDGNDSVKMKKMIIMSSDSEGKHGEHMFVHGDAKKVKVMKSKDGEAMVWTSKEDGDHKVIKEGNVIVYKTGDETLDIIKSEDGDHKIVKEVIVNKDGSVEKRIEVIITEDGDHSIIKIKGDEADLGNIEENVKIYKYITDDGKITIKAEITDSESGDNENIKKEFKKVKISPNPTDGKFRLEFELSNKENVVVKVNNESGKSVYSKKVRKFTGSFSEDIDISKEEKGIYLIQIIQGDKTITKKIQKR